MILSFFLFIYLFFLFSRAPQGTWIKGLLRNFPHLCPLWFRCAHRGPIFEFRPAFKITSILRRFAYLGHISHFNKVPAFIFFLLWSTSKTISKIAVISKESKLFHGKRSDRRHWRWREKHQILSDFSEILVCCSQQRLSDRLYFGFSIFAIFDVFTSLYVFRHPIFDTLSTAVLFRFLFSPFTM